MKQLKLIAALLVLAIPCSAQIATGPGIVGGIVNPIAGPPTFTLGTGTGACATSSTLVGGTYAGSFLCTGTAGASTQVVNLPAAPNGWICWASDVTSGVAWATVVPVSTTSAKVTGTIAVTSDRVAFGCWGF